MTTAGSKPKSRAFSPRVAQAICDGLAKGQTLLVICQAEGMPTDRMVRHWINPKSKHYQWDDFALEVQISREMGFEVMAEECNLIADARTGDWTDRVRGDGTVERVFDHEHAQRSKLRIETRLKLLSKWAPRVFGDKIETTVRGPSLLELLEQTYKQPNTDGSVPTLPHSFDPRTGLLQSSDTGPGGSIGGRNDPPAAERVPAWFSEDVASAAAKNLTT